LSRYDYTTFFGSFCKRVQFYTLFIILSGLSLILFIYLLFQLCELCLTLCWFLGYNLQQVPFSFVSTFILFSFFFLFQVEIYKQIIKTKDKGYSIFKEKLYPIIYLRFILTVKKHTHASERMGKE